ncbi:MAG: ATP-binding cassette domain-containing protein [Bacteroidetes bacterium]|nr:ATP-binding cassette domain-containing protein [Bacteroidota bacterium]MBU1486288.1 ATP-binding cassette domain-containing protein [Bacteroidota bacterium]MBU2267209.1 ATP-binding cassette domain-containing protein [Bacteroidota bacterium]MBU2376076.1 ATP-binding cassette domain-containing protein [Bacteroidota bacterium]
MLKVSHIVKEYAKHRALDDVSLEVEKGTIFGLLGPNGAGKTSLIRIINQITGPDAGEVFFNGEKLNQSHINKIGYLPEERGLYKKMEIGEQMLYLAQLKGLSRADATNRIKYWFEKMEMQNWWKKKVEDLSKGMQQKVQFVATILHEPELIILDEPFTGFDPVNAEVIKNEILELNQKGATIIFSTHRMESVEELCDHIALINKSHKILDGSVKSIKNAYRNNTFRVGLTREFDTSTLKTFEIISSKKEEESENFTIKLKDGFSTNDVLQELLPQTGIIYLEEVIPSINEIFIEKVKQLN